MTATAASGAPEAQHPDTDTNRTVSSLHGPTVGAQSTSGAGARTPAERRQHFDTRMIRKCQNEHEPDGDLCPGFIEFGPGDPQAACTTCGAWEGRWAPGWADRIMPAALPVQPDTDDVPVELAWVAAWERSRRSVRDQQIHQLTDERNQAHKGIDNLLSDLKAMTADLAAARAEVVALRAANARLTAELDAERAKTAGGTWSTEHGHRWSEVNVDWCAAPFHCDMACDMERDVWTGAARQAGDQADRG